MASALNASFAESIIKLPYRIYVYSASITVYLQRIVQECLYSINYHETLSPQFYTILNEEKKKNIFSSLKFCHEFQLKRYSYIHTYVRENFLKSKCKSKYPYR